MRETGNCARAATPRSEIGATIATRAARRLRGTTQFQLAASCDSVQLAPMRPQLPRAMPQDQLKVAGELPCGLSCASGRKQSIVYLA